MSDKIELSDADQTKNPLSPGEVGVLMRVVRSRAVAEVDLVESWGMGPWAAKALAGLLTRDLVIRLDDVSQFIGQRGCPSKPAPWIIPTRAGTSALLKEQDVAFPPSGDWLIYDGVLLNPQPPDLLIQLIEYLMSRGGGLSKGSPDTELRSESELLDQLNVRLSEIKQTFGDIDWTN